MGKNSFKFRHLLIALFLTPVVGVVVIFGLIAFLRTPSGSRLLIEKGRGWLERNADIKVDFASGSIDVLHGFHFRDLRILINRDDANGSISIPAVDLDYSLTYSPIGLRISELKVDRPAIDLTLKGSAEKPQPPAKPARTDGGGLSALIQNPPATLIIERVDVQGLQLKFRQTSPAAEASVSTSVEAKDVALNLRAELIKNHIFTAGAFSCASPLVVSKTAASGSFSLRPGAQWSARWSVRVERVQNEWIYQIEPGDVEATLQGIKLVSNAPGGNSVVSLHQVQVRGHAKLLAKSKELFEPSADAVQTLDLSAKVSLGPLSIQNEGKSKSNAIRIGQQTLSLIAGLENQRGSGGESEIAIETRYAAERVLMGEVFSRPTTLGLSAISRLPRSLKSFSTESLAQINGIELLQLKAAGDVSPGKTHLHGNAKITADPKLARSIKPAAVLAKTGLIQLDSEFSLQSSQSGNASEGQIDLKARVPKLSLPQVPHPFAFDFNTHATWTARVPQDTTDNIAYDTNFELTSRHRDFGAWRIQNNLALTGTQKGEGQTTLTELTPPNPEKIPIHLGEPLVLKHRFDLGKGQGLIALDGLAPAVELKGMAKLAETHITANVRSPNLKLARDLDIDFDLKQSGVNLDAKLRGAAPPITSVALGLKALLRGGTQFTLETLRANVNDKLLRFNANAAGNLKSKDLQAHASVDFEAPPDFPALAGQKITGSVQVPMSLSVARGEDINLDGRVDLNNIKLEKGTLVINGLDGHIPFGEKLRWDGKHIRFAELITQNPFERVDFERVRPLLRGTEQLRIANIGWAERSYGPFIGFFSLRQNMIFAHQFDLDLGRGRVYGEAFFNTYPSNLQVGVLSRMTGIDLAEILPKKFLGRAPTGDKNVSGRSGFVINLNRGTLDGRVDVTEIGGPQLITLVNVLDPNYEDEKLNKVRSLLQVGYPTSVELVFNQGYLDMGIGLSLLGVRQYESLRGIPVSSLISQATSEVVKQTQKGPLK